MRLNNLTEQPTNKPRKRKGRGMATGNGKTAGRGTKGQKSRSGGFHKVGFEGGQMPLQRRLPKSGFKNRFSKEHSLVNLDTLDSLKDISEINIEGLLEKGIIGRRLDGVKLLGRGEISHAMTVHVDLASKSAIEKIEAAGGKVVLSPPPSSNDGQAEA